MNLQAGLWQEQTQRLALTPKLQQSLQILQYSSLDLLSYLEAQCEQNPVLEWEPADWRRYLDFLRGRSPNERMSSANQEVDRPQRETAALTGRSLEDSLQLQVQLAQASLSVKKVANHLIGCLDDNGYLSVDIPYLIEELHISHPIALEAISLLQSCEPIGVGARTLKECLRLQANDRYREDTLLHQLIEEHLEDIARGKWTKLAKELQVTVQEVQAAVDRLRKLEPKPGRQASLERPVWVLPDVVVQKENEGWKVSSFKQASPRLRISSSYEKLLQKSSLEQDLKHFLQEQLNKAFWVVKSVEQRKATILKVMEALVGLQMDYFEKGSRYLKPLTLKQVADQLGLHESTIHRTTVGKYAQTPWGVIEIKSLFSSGVETHQGDGVSSKSIQEEMKRMIEQEDAANPLSDQKMTDLLQVKGFSISRRTVAKYREAMGIGPASSRQRF